MSIRIAGSLGAALLLVGCESASPPPPPAAKVIEAPQSQPEEKLLTALDGWRVQENPELGAAFSYPEEWKTEGWRFIAGDHKVAWSFWADAGDGASCSFSFWADRYAPPVTDPAAWAASITRERAKQGHSQAIPYIDSSNKFVTPTILELSPASLGGLPAVAYTLEYKYRRVYVGYGDEVEPETIQLVRQRHFRARNHVADYHLRCRASSPKRFTELTETFDQIAARLVIGKEVFSVKDGWTVYEPDRAATPLPDDLATLIAAEPYNIDDACNTVWRKYYISPLELHPERQAVQVGFQSCRCNTVVGEQYSTPCRRVVYAEKDGKWLRLGDMGVGSNLQTRRTSDTGEWADLVDYGANTWRVKIYEWNPEQGAYVGREGLESSGKWFFWLEATAAELAARVAHPALEEMIGPPDPERLARLHNYLVKGYKHSSPGKLAAAYAAWLYHKGNIDTLEDLLDNMEANGQVMSAHDPNWPTYEAAVNTLP